eukprot:scaffold3408_cov129-Amphora_coffeaeformis.AAC.5
MDSSTSTGRSIVTILGSALCGAAAYAGVQRLLKNSSKSKQAKPTCDPETDYTYAHDKVWTCIGGALQASQLYIGDRLKLYSVLREACAKPGSFITAIELAEQTGLHQRWLREWLAQQAAMGVLKLLPGSGNDDADLQYRLPRAMAEVLANPDSKEYDISMIATVPSLVNRAKTMLPEAFATGIGRPYDEPEVAEAIDRQHQLEIREVVIPKIIPAADGGKALEAMQKGCKVADLGCGAGNLILAMAKAFPNSTFHGYEVSEQALSVGATHMARSKQRNASLIDANVNPLGAHEDQYDVITTFDVLHDAPNPAELILQVKKALKPGGVWILGDIPAKDTMRENIESNPKARVYFAFSTCLCMSCSLSTKDGAGLGTLGFTVPVAKKMLTEGGFSKVKVLLETPSVRWFEVMA